VGRLQPYEAFDLTDTERVVARFEELRAARDRTP
jgi:hypothetical protein